MTQSRKAGKKPGVVPASSLSDYSTPAQPDSINERAGTIIKELQARSQAADKAADTLRKQMEGLKPQSEKLTIEHLKSEGQRKEDNYAQPLAQSELVMQPDNSSKLRSLGRQSFTANSTTTESKLIETAEARAAAWLKAVSSCTESMPMTPVYIQHFLVPSTRVSSPTPERTRLQAKSAALALENKTLREHLARAKQEIIRLRQRKDAKSQDLVGVRARAPRSVAQPMNMARVEDELGGRVRMLENQVNKDRTEVGMLKERFERTMLHHGLKVVDGSSHKTQTS